MSVDTVNMVSSGAASTVTVTALRATRAGPPRLPATASATAQAVTMK
ncbi:MAG TPA: hypothetical protein VHZ03_30890 [Trebonia sp.]|nr:hypothetical protein [Trebonia sp.]